MDVNSREPLRILALNKRSWLDSEPGGAERNLEKTLTHLSERGHDVHLLSGESGRNAVESHSGVSIHQVGHTERLGGAIDFFLSYLLVSLYYYWYLYKLSPDVVYTVNTPLPWPVIAFAPRVAIYHHISLDSFFETHPFPTNLVGYVAQCLGIYRDRDVHTVSVSPSTTEELVDRGHPPETVHEIRNGVDVRKYTFSDPSPHPRVLYLGGLVTEKGADRIPEIYDHLRRMSSREIHLDIAGRHGPERSTIERYSADKSCVTFHGYVSEEEKLALLESAWVLLAPSRIEGYGIAIIEANASKTPAIGSDIKGLRDSIKHEETGLLVAGDDSERFARAVLRLVENTDLRTEMSDTARDWAESHSWERSAARLEHVFYRSADSDSTPL
ncbi:MULTISPECIES: glycosyltransferase family 4 protein [Haloarcula]|uniref:glycosyltransferase family 4 protein n=1 Tax=Haloarcula TaxID=2237 RepID=UPI0023EC3937|nr:glycosyltransferase family 4 protein [Halomicroarcula sp. XH51]